MRYEDFEYNLIVSGIKIDEYTGYSATSVNIPARIAGLPVTSIGKEVFSGCDKLREIHLLISLNTADINRNMKSFIEKYSDKIFYYKLPYRFVKKIVSLRNKPNISTKLLNLFNQMEPLLIKDYTSAWNDSVTKILNNIETAHRKQQEINGHPVINLIVLMNSVSDKKIDNASKYARKLNEEVAEIEARIKNGIKALTAPKVIEKKKRRAAKAKNDSSDWTVPNIILPANFGESIGMESEPSEDFEYEDDGLEITIVKYKGSSDSVNISAQINGLPVTAIGDYAFWFCSSLTSIHFPNSLRNVKGTNNTLERFRNEYKDKIRYYQTTSQTIKAVGVPDFWRDNFNKNQPEPKSNFK